MNLLNEKLLYYLFIKWKSIPYPNSKTRLKVMFSLWGNLGEWRFSYVHCHFIFKLIYLSYTYCRTLQNSVDDGCANTRYQKRSWSLRRMKMKDDFDGWGWPATKLSQNCNDGQIFLVTRVDGNAKFMDKRNIIAESQLMQRTKRVQHEQERQILRAAVASSTRGRAACESQWSL